MRALIVVNPKATATTARTRDVLASALGSDLAVDVRQTKGRGHATELAAAAVANGDDVVVALGGDGTVNEVVNGLLADGPRPGLPSLAVVPVGSTNVFARALGLPNSPVEATGALLEALRDGRSRRVGLGLADERWFTFCGGIGIDAAAVHGVEEQRARGRKASSALYVRSAVGRFYRETDRRRPVLTLSAPSLPAPRPLFAALVCNTDPWTYYKSRPVRPCPAASFDTGLDVFGLDRMSTPFVLRQVRRFFSANPHFPSEHVLSLHDEPEIRIEAGSPQCFQVDGESLGERAAVTFRSVPNALRVVV